MSVLSCLCLFSNTDGLWLEVVCNCLCSVCNNYHGAWTNNKQTIDRISHNCLSRHTVWSEHTFLWPQLMVFMTGTGRMIRVDGFCCAADWEPPPQLGWIGPSDFSLRNTRWSCDHAARHAAAAASTNSICMRATRNTEGWSDCRPLRITSMLLFSPLCGVSLRNKRLEKVKLFTSICVLEILTVGPQRARKKHEDCGGIHLMLPIVWQSAPLI